MSAYQIYAMLAGELRILSEIVLMKRPIMLNLHLGFGYVLRHISEAEEEVTLASQNLTLLKMMDLDRRR